MLAAVVTYKVWTRDRIATDDTPHHTLRVTEACNSEATLREYLLVQESVDNPGSSAKPQLSTVENAECDILKPGRVAYLVSERKPLTPITIAKSFFDALEVKTGEPAF